jgi:hypothetical protein
MRLGRWVSDAPNKSMRIGRQGSDAPSNSSTARVLFPTNNDGGKRLFHSLSSIYCSAVGLVACLLTSVHAGLLRNFGLLDSDGYSTHKQVLCNSVYFYVLLHTHSLTSRYSASRSPAHRRPASCWSSPASPQLPWTSDSDL